MHHAHFFCVLFLIFFHRKLGCAMLILFRKFIKLTLFVILFCYRSGISLFGLEHAWCSFSFLLGFIEDKHMMHSISLEHSSWLIIFSFYSMYDLGATCSFGLVSTPSLFVSWLISQNVKMHHGYLRKKTNDIYLISFVIS